MAIQVERHDEEHGVRIIVRGDVDMTTGGRLEQEVLRAETDAPPTLTLDLSEVDFFDSTGLQILLDADVRASEAGRQVIVVPGSGEAARVLTLTQVADRLNVAVDE